MENRPFRHAFSEFRSSFPIKTTFYTRGSQMLWTQVGLLTLCLCISESGLSHEDALEGMIYELNPEEQIRINRSQPAWGFGMRLGAGIGRATCKDPGCLFGEL